MLKLLLYSRVVTSFLFCICRCFFPSCYLKGKFFEEKRMGYLWALKSVPRLLYLRRQKVKWPVGKSTIVLGGDKIKFDNSSINVFQQSGCYFQAFERIEIGRDVWIGPNTGIITANHKLTNPELHEDGKPVVIHDKVWIGMNSVILPGVELGPHVVVGAGSIVTKSYPDGWCVIAGNPAKIIKTIKHEDIAL